MFHKQKLTVLLLSLTLISAFSFTGCKKDANAYQCPYSEATWETTADDLIELEGETNDTYDSIYNGTTYTYKKSYQEKEGTVKYMYDDKDTLMTIAWTYTADNNDDIMALYDIIHKEIEDACGPGEDSKENPTTVGDIWRRDSGNIIITTMNTESLHALQVSFSNPDLNIHEDIGDGDSSKEN